jgi:hypothetical protein
MSNNTKPETIELVELRKLANSSNKIKHAARKALTIAEHLHTNHKLGSILLDRNLRHIQVYGATGESGSSRQSW